MKQSLLLLLATTLWAQDSLSLREDLERAEVVRAAGMSTDVDVLSIRVHLAAVTEQRIQRAADLEVAKLADIQVNLRAKDERKLQSHEIAKQMRERLLPAAARYGARIKVAEVPPGPPVPETLVAEVYGPDLDERIGIARRIRDLMDVQRRRSSPSRVRPARSASPSQRH